jgi:hypothetical protein
MTNHVDLTKLGSPVEGEPDQETRLRIVAAIKKSVRREVIDEIGVLLAEYEMETNQTHPGMFKKLSILRDKK